MSSTDEPDEAAIAELDADTAGAVLVDGDDGYDDARHVWNGRFDQHPAVIVGCQTTIDVRAAIDFAKGRSLPLAVKGGGHDYGGNPARDDSVLIDCSSMDSIDVDSEAGVARVGPGVTWAEFDQEAQQYGLATTGATVSSVGIRRVHVRRGHRASGPLARAGCRQPPVGRGRDRGR